MSAAEDWLRCAEAGMHLSEAARFLERSPKLGRYYAKRVGFKFRKGTPGRPSLSRMMSADDAHLYRKMLDHGYRSAEAVSLIGYHRKPAYPQAEPQCGAQSREVYFVTMNGLPYYKRFPRDLIEGTVGMPFEEKVTYAFILDLIYMHGGRLPDDPRYIAGVLGASVRKWNAVRSALIERGKLQANGGFLTNYRAIIELESLGKFQDKQRENRARPNKTKDLQSPRSDHTEPDTDIRTETIVSVARKRATPKTRIPPDAIISEQMRAAAEQRGLSDAEAEAQFCRFRDWAVAKGQAYADWNAAWRNWLTSSFFRPVTGQETQHAGQHSRRVSAFLAGARR